MKIKIFIINFLFLSSSVFADLRPPGPSTTTTVPTPTTEACAEGYTNCGALPQATNVVKSQNSALQKLAPFAAGAAAGGACWLLATSLTPCASCSAGAAVCCGAPAAACALAAGMLVNNMQKAKERAEQTIASVNSNPTNPTAYNNGPTPTPGPTDTTTPDPGVTAGGPAKTPNKPVGSIKLPDGRVLNTKDLGNDAALAKAGFSPSEIAGINTMTSAIAKKAEADLKAGLDKGDSMFADGLGGGSGKTPTSSGDLNPDVAALRTPSAALAAGKEQATGLAKRCGDSMCGTANDGIFVMINRRVVQQCDANQVNCK